MWAVATRIVAKGLNVTGDLVLNGEHAFKRSTRIHATVAVDGAHALAQAEWRGGGEARAEMVVGDGDGAGEMVETIAVLVAVGRQAKRAVGQAISETKALGRGAEVLHAHADFTFRCQKTVDGLGWLFGFWEFRGEENSGERAEEGAPRWRGR